jgi:hypothetical protein
VCRRQLLPELQRGCILECKHNAAIAAVTWLGGATTAGKVGSRALFGTRSSPLCTDEYRLEQAEALLVMRRTWSLSLGQGDRKNLF